MKWAKIKMQMYIIKCMLSLVNEIECNTVYFTIFLANVIQCTIGSNDQEHSSVVLRPYQIWIINSKPSGWLRS